MTPAQLYPDSWKDIMDKKIILEKNIFEAEKPKAMTDQFLCSKCKSRETVYSEVQLRSCDEPMSLFIRCIKCSHKWRIG
jgi:DNA-directed RNA polymerase subunit M/transcription elongation factor TFIIS